MAMTVPSTRFGELTVDEQSLLCFPGGLIGLACERWLLLTREPASPFLWLQSAEDPELALPVTRPELFYPDYTLAVPESLLESIGLAEGAEVEVLAVVRSAQHIEDFTINLRGPLVIDAARRVGAQIATLIEYPVDAPLLDKLVDITRAELGPPALPILTVAREEV